MPVGLSRSAVHSRCCSTTIRTGPSRPPSGGTKPGTVACTAQPSPELTRKKTTGEGPTGSVRASFRRSRRSYSTPTPGCKSKWSANGRTTAGLSSSRGKAASLHARNRFVEKATGMWILPLAVSRQFFHARVANLNHAPSRIRATLIKPFNAVRAHRICANRAGALERSRRISPMHPVQR